MTVHTEKETERRREPITIWGKPRLVFQRLVDEEEFSERKIWKQEKVPPLIQE